MPYVYRHIRLDKNEPFYIGIGKDDWGYKTYKALIQEYKEDVSLDWINTWTTVKPFENSKLPKEAFMIEQSNLQVQPQFDPNSILLEGCQ